MAFTSSQKLFVILLLVPLQNVSQRTVIYPHPITVDLAGHGCLFGFLIDVSLIDGNLVAAE